MDDQYDENGNAPPPRQGGGEGGRQREFDKIAAPCVRSNQPTRAQTVISSKANAQRAAESPSPIFLSVGEALSAADLVAARDLMVSALLQQGINYTDFKIVSNRYARGRTRLALRTVNAPMPPSLYNPVMAAFEDVGGPYFEGFENMAAVMLADEAGGWVPIHPCHAQADQWLALKCGVIASNIGRVQGEIADWKSQSEDQTEYLCWPAVARGDFGRTCVVVSMVDRCFPHTKGGSDNFEPLRGFIRSLPEYRRHVG